MSEDLTPRDVLARALCPVLSMFDFEHNATTENEVAIGVLAELDAAGWSVTAKETL